MISATPQLAGAALSYLGSAKDQDPYQRELNAARTAQAQRQQSLTRNTAQVGAAFGSNDDYYKRVRSGVFDYQKNSLDTERDKQSRELKFELARRGHLGGSAEIDAVGELSRLYSEGLLNAGSLADGTVNSVRSSDERAKNQAQRDVLLDIDANTAIQGGVNQAQLASQQALDSAKGQNLGDVFGGLGYLYQQGQAKKERTRANVDYAARRGSTVGPASSNSGTIRRG